MPEGAEREHGGVTASAPVVSVPSGGGAVRGMGERFAAGPVTGTGTATVPIATSPGRAGFGPQLVLSYDSGAGNGLFGVGWSLDVASIARRTDTGVPRYDEGDVFVLSGADDLVPGEDAPGPPGVTVRRYRPRVEGLFARIERWTRDADGDVHWRSWSRDDVLTVYGPDPGSRIADPADPTRVFRWLVREIRDGRGNAVVYDYRQENDDDVDVSAPHEAPRVRGANRHLKRIRYGNRDPLLAADGTRPVDAATDATDWMFEVVLDYGEHDPDVPRPDDDGVWTRRRDPFSTHRAGFEIRTYRLCRRILMFHHFPDEPGVGAGCLVGSTDIGYRASPGDDEGRVRGQARGSFVADVTRRGYRGDGDGYLRRSLPPLELTWSEAVVGRDVGALESDDGPGVLGSALDASGARWVDLDGEGVSGLLSTDRTGWYYRRNTSPLTGTARLGPLEPVASVPAGADPRDPEWRLTDLDGDGRLDLVGAAGSHGRADGGWSAYRPFRTAPAAGLAGPDVALVDLTGDGLADLVRDDVWFRSLGADGFDVPQPVAPELDTRRSLRAGRTETVGFADLSGDGLPDAVRVRNGEVCYWPNLGHGRFGPRVTMDGAPVFDHPDRFDPRRLHLADVDGSGTTDLVYTGTDRTVLWFNESGNGWSAGEPVDAAPPVDDATVVDVTDLLGDGTACLVWSTPLPSAAAPVRYLRLAADGKPHLLVGTDNNLGAEVVIGYAPSTVFAQRDRADGHPWVTRLPYPVHVVARVQVTDRISGARHVSRHSYRHGHFDGVEREFRGFGMVETVDTEVAAPGEAPDTASDTPPVVTRTWYHTGAVADRVSLAHAGLDGGRGEYHREPAWLDDPAEAARHLLPDTVLPPGLTAEEERQAARALKGSLLRQEVYADDGTGSPEYPLGHPYAVTEQNLTVRMLAPKGDRRHAVFLTHPREKLTHHYERDPEDPRTVHELTLEVDDTGTVLRSVSVAYGRRRPDPDLPAADRERQATPVLTASETGTTNAVDTAGHYRTPLPAQVSMVELTGYTPSGPDGRFVPDDLVRPDPDRPGRFLAVVDAEVPFEAEPGPGRVRRLLRRERTVYRSDDLTRLLPCGGHGSLEPGAVAGERYTLAFTAGLIENVYRRGDESLLPDPAAVLGAGGGQGGGYRSGDELRAAGLFPADDPDGQWWTTGGRVFLSADPAGDPAAELAAARARFFLPVRYRDPFHTGDTPTETVVDYDRYDLIAATTRDPAGNVVSVHTTGDDGVTAPRIDYRVLAPYGVTDPNGNRTHVAYDALGLVVGTAVMGRPNRAEGDSLDGFDPDPDEDVLLAHLAAPDDDPAALLGRATTRVVHDLHAFRRTRHEPRPQPAGVCVIARETHDRDPVPDGGLRVQHAYAYHDGFGRPVQRKTRAEPGPVPARGPDGAPTLGPDGRPVLAGHAARWVGSGWTVHDDKGNPVRRYEPFFTDTPRFESDPRIGVSPVLCHDALGRVVAAVAPDHTWQKVVHGPWRRTAWDAADTVLVEDPRTDPDAGAYLRRLPETDVLPTWRARRVAPDADPAERDAARKAEVHADTPTVTHLDPLGRPFLTVVQNAVRYDDAPDGTPRTETVHRARIEHDVLGTPRAVLDEQPGPDGVPVPRVVARYDHDLRGTVLRQASLDSGERWVLPDAAGHPLLSWDARGHRLRGTFDALRRPRESLLRTGDGPEIVVGRTAYGEDLPDPEAGNRRGRVAEVRDQSGLLTTLAYGLGGQPERSVRRLLADHRSVVDWAAGPELDGVGYASTTRHDALGRPTQLVAPYPDEPGAPVAVLQPVYNEANLPERLHAWLRRDAPPEGLLDPATADLDAVTGVEYDERGRRAAVVYGNGVRTTATHDPLTGLLAALVTRRDPAAFPDDCPQPADPAWPGCGLQSLHFTHDPAGRVTAVRDDAQQAVFFRNRRVEAGCGYTYDAAGRLVEATGREHLGQVGAAPEPSGPADVPRTGVPLPGDGDAMARYRERYVYDLAGNIESLTHRGPDPAVPGWTRTYRYAEPSLLEPDRTGNRLTATRVGDRAEETYPCDAHGNVTAMGHLPVMEWDHHDRLRTTGRQVVNGDGQGARTWYVYDADGARVRKVTESATGTVVEERIYLGAVELYRRHGSDPLTRRTLHLTAGDLVAGTVETRIDGTEPDVPQDLVRYRHGDRLGSTVLELDDRARIVSREEYTPYGSTAVASVRSRVEAPNRYRFTGVERDEESGLGHHGARYYAPWLGRWTSPDPIGVAGGPNAYAYLGGDPLSDTDRTGTQGDNAHASAGPKIRTLDDALNHLARNPQDCRTTNTDLAKFGAGLTVSGNEVVMTVDGKVVARARAPGEDDTETGGPDGGDPMAEGGQGGYYAAGLVYGWAQYQAGVGAAIKMPWEITGAHHDPADEAAFAQGAAFGLMLASTRDQAQALAMATEIGLGEAAANGPRKYGGVALGGTGTATAMADYAMVQVHALEARAAAGAAAAALLNARYGGGTSAPPGPQKDDYRGRFNESRVQSGKKPLPSEYDAHHRIPQEYRNHPEFKDFDFDKPSNIRGVKGWRAVLKGKARHPYHQEITDWWSQFRKLNPNATRQQIEHFANQIDSIYSRYYFK